MPSIKALQKDLLSAENNRDEKKEQLRLAKEAGDDVAAKLAEAEVTLAQGVIDALKKELDAGKASLDEDFKNDLKNGQALATAVSDDMRWHCEDKNWWKYDGIKWQQDIEKTIQLRYAQMVAALPEHKRGWRSEAKHARSAWSLAEAHLPLRAEQLDTDIFVLNCLNGTVDLKTGLLKPHQASDLLSKVAPVEYDPDAKCPLFKKFLGEIMNDNPALIGFLNRLFGYGITGDTREEVFAICYGRGGNGKSTLLEGIRTAIGGYAQNADFKTFVRTKSERIRTDLARMKGARLVTAGESAEEQALDEQVVKQAVNVKDPITARHLYGREFDFHPQAKIILSCNHKPKIEGTDEGIWRRALLIPFVVEVEKGKRDLELGSKLAKEASGILTWMVQGCLEWQANGLCPPDEVLVATQEYRLESDDLGRFIADECVVDPKGKVAAGTLYEAYDVWIAGSGIERLDKASFGKKINARGFGTKTSNSTRLVYGLRLKAYEEKHPKQKPEQVPETALEASVVLF